MIDKSALKWKNAPLWVRFGLWSIGTRRVALAFEIASAATALTCLVLGFVNANLFIGTLLFAAAYWYAICTRWVDNAGLW